MKRLFFILVFFFNHGLFSLPVDFDVVVVGSSPIPLLEALYQSHLGKRVLVIEESPVLGGAWKSIEVCGKFPVDLGCHTLGNDRQIFHFLEEYVGCKMVSMDNPHLPYDIKYSPNGFYPSRGCYEMMQNLFQLIQNTDIVVLFNHLLEQVTIDPEFSIATVKTKDLSYEFLSKDNQFTTSKIIVTPYSHLCIENDSSAEREKIKFYHLYMLIEDPTPCRFTFRTGVFSGVSRMMNLSYFIGLEETGTQLFVLQTYSPDHLESKAELYLENMKKKGLVDSSARILKTQSYVYEQSSCRSFDEIRNSSAIFELLQTGHIQEMTKYISKWKEVLPPFQAAAGKS